MDQFHWTLESHRDFDLLAFIASLDAPKQATVIRFLEQVRDFSRLVEAPHSWIKALGQGLFEFRIKDKNVLLRIFFTYRNGRIILLLGGYDKGLDPSAKRQQREIMLARRRLKDA